MSTLTSYASAAARDSAAPASSNTGLCIFRSDTKAIEVSDGTNYLTYNNDGMYQTFSNNSYSGSFDGTNDYVQIPSIGALNSPSALSVSLWFKYQGTPSFDGLIFGGSSSSVRWGVQLSSSTNLRYFGGNSSFDDFTVSLNSSTWYHVAVSHNGTSATMYLNGSSLGSATVPNPNAAPSGGIKIGAYYDGSNSYQGYMDEVALFDYALSSTEVSNIYNSKSYRDLLALYRLENDVTDETGNYDATNNGVTFSNTEKPY